VIFTGWSAPDEGAAGELIRDVQQVPVLIHDDPKGAISEEPWRWQAFNLHPGMLAGRWDSLQELAATCGQPWVAKAMILTGERRDVESDSRAPLLCDWQDITNPKQFASALMIALPTALAHYDNELGFALRDPDRLPGLPAPSEQGWHSTERVHPRRARASGYGRDRQTYLEHISRLVNAYSRGLGDELAWASACLEKDLGLQPGSVDAAIRLALACHDIGKLSVDWQAYAQEWEQRIALQRQIAPPGEQLLAKTEFDPRPDRGHRELQRALGRAPHHAVEGVALADPFMRSAISRTATGSGGERLLRATRSAIARHHTLDAERNARAQLAPGAPAAIQGAIALACGTLAWSSALPPLHPATRVESDAVEETFTEFRKGGKDSTEVWLFFLIVRALRLADQRADTMRTIAPSNGPER
jgi:CRISPR-associated endonuclease/helicase Cas3